MSYSKTIIEGRVGKDPETRYTPNGKTVCNFSVAVGEKRGGEEETTWFRVVTFEKTAEIAQQYVTKGGSVLVEGRMKSRQWDDKQTGQKREAWELVCDRLVLLGGKREASEPVQKHAKDKSNAYASDFDDSIPF